MDRSGKSDEVAKFKWKLYLCIGTVKYLPGTFVFDNFRGEKSLSLRADGHMTDVVKVSFDMGETFLIGVV